MLFLVKLKKFVGYIVVIFAIFLGIIAMSVAEWDQVFANIFLYLLLGGLPFVIGVWMIEGWKSLKVTAWGKFRFYTAITFFSPIIIRTISYVNDKKEERVSSATDIFVDYAGTPKWLTYLVMGAGIIAFMTFLAIYVNWFDMERHVYFMFVVSLIISIVVPLIAKDDFRAIREEGLYFSIQGDIEEVPWYQIERVEIVGNNVDGIGSSNSAYFKWDFIFFLKNGDKEKFGSFSYSNYNLTTSLEIKNEIMEHRVSMSLDGLSDEEWSYVEIDMEYEEGDPHDFYELFQYNPETKEYYHIPYN